MSSWSRVPGVVTVCISDNDARRLGLDLSHFESDELGLLDIEIHFLSSGYYEPASTYGPPEDCHPEELEDERFLAYVTIDGEKVDQALAERIFDMFSSEVDDANFDMPDPDIPGYYD